MTQTECDVPVPGIFHFFGGIGTGIGKIWYRKKVSEPVSVKFGIGIKSRNRYRENLVPKKVSESVSKIFGTVKKYRYRYRLTFWVPSHTGARRGEPKFYILFAAINPELTEIHQKVHFPRATRAAPLVEFTVQKSK